MPQTVLIPNWLLGRHVTTAIITPITQYSYNSINIEDQDAGNLVGQLQEINFNIENILENVTATDNRYSNGIIVETNAEIKLTEILKNAAATPSAKTSLLGNFISNYDTGRFVFARGGNAWTFFGVAKLYREDIVRGKSVATLTLSMISPVPGNNPLRYSY